MPDFRTMQLIAAVFLLTACGAVDTIEGKSDGKNGDRWAAKEESAGSKKTAKNSQKTGAPKVTGESEVGAGGGPIDDAPVNAAKANDEAQIPEVSAAPEAEAAPSEWAEYNLKVLNAIRAEAGAGPLTLDVTLSKTAEDGSRALADTGVAHGNFRSITPQTMAQHGFCRTGAENQAPRWPGGDPKASIDGILQMMMNEGPGGGHHDNILNPAFTRVGISILIESGTLTLTNDFSAPCK